MILDDLVATTAERLSLRKQKIKFEEIKKT